MGVGAGDAIRTRDIYLGKVVLYQLSYSRRLGRSSVVIGAVLTKKGPSGTGQKNRKNPRADLLFRDAAIQVPLAQRCFTTQFGMGWGGASVL